MAAMRPVMEHAGLIPEDSFFDDKDRRLRFNTNDPMVDICPMSAVLMWPHFLPMARHRWGLPVLTY